jgi:cytochrome c-type biogenesis protein CcmH
LIRAALLLCCLASPLWAVEPSEVLSDPVLETRARALSTALRCPVCRNESIDESSATLAKDLRIILRERLVAGDSDAEAVNFLVARYGEFILLKPDVTGVNWILWGAAPAMLLLALATGWTVIRRKPNAADLSLTDAEKKRLDQILGD